MTNEITNKSPEWVQRVLKDNPCRLAEGGNITTCPVRLSFPYLITPQKAMEDGKPDKYAATLLFPMGADLSVIHTEMQRVAVEKWGDQLAAYMQSDGFHKPIKDQAEKAKYAGYIAGAKCITATGERKPSLVDQRMAPIVDPSKVYPGVWAICSIRSFTFETRNKQNVVLKRGLGFGLQSVMIIADDVEFGGGFVDPNVAFSGVKIDADVNPSAMFGAAGEPEQKQALASLFE